jgi:hypothetical protein
MEQPMDHTIVKRRKSLGWPLILITIGVIFLLNNTGILSGDAWDLIVRFWPLILIIGGLDSIYRGDGLAGGLLFVTVGSIILLNNLGYLAWDVWGMIFRFWPVLIIVIGTDIILGRYLRSTWAAVVGLVLVVVIVGGLLWFAGTNPIPARAVAMESVQLPLENINRADVTLSPATGKITVQGTSDTTALIIGNFRKTKTDKVEEISSVENNSAAYTLRSQGGFYNPVLTNDNLSTWEVELTQAIPISLDFSLGVGAADLILTKVQLEHLKVRMAIGQTTVLLPEGKYEADIDGAIGEIVLKVPADLPVRIIATHGMSGFEVRGDLIKNGNVLTTRSYAGATERVEVRVNQAMGNLVVQTVP